MVYQEKEKENPLYPNISPQTHAKYQNLEKQGTLYTYERPNFGVIILYGILDLKSLRITYTLPTLQAKKNH